MVSKATERSRVKDSVQILIPAMSGKSGGLPKCAAQTEMCGVSEISEKDEGMEK